MEKEYLAKNVIHPLVETDGILTDDDKRKRKIKKLNLKT